MIRIFKRIIKSYNHFEIKLRHNLSNWPILYAFIGSIGVVLIWRGVWMIADDINMSGGVSLVLGVVISIIIGLFVSFFVGERIIIAGIKNEKRIDEKTESEIRKEEITLVEIQKDLRDIKNDINDN